MGGEWTVLRLGNVCSKIGSGDTPRGGSSVCLDKGDIARELVKTVRGNVTIDWALA
jgi:hypothetical protein